MSQTNELINELMVEDWVRLVKAYGNTQDDIMIVDALDLYRISQGDYEVEPITLTPEILENNGFNEVIDTCKIHTYHDKKTGINIVMFSTPETTIFSQKSFLVKSIKTKYVHELQHILRLCKIDKEIII